MSKITEWGVYYVPTKQASIFAGLSMELVAKFPEKEDAYKYCLHLNTCGYLDELHVGYTVRPI